MFVFVYVYATVYVWNIKEALEDLYRKSVIVMLPTVFSSESVFVWDN